jgi:D-glycerate 3-kinase
VGALPQPDADLVPPVNALERDEDAQEVWRRAINGRLADDYAALFARLDRTLYLRPPAFEQVLDWRCEQEATLLGGPPLPSGRRTELARFVQHYERLTRHMMDGGVDADLVIQLDANRRAVATAGRLAR